ncbi:DNA ligase 4-like [Artemia franciscana]|uniref:DNA ligase 4 n=1 Tax=Artemia franciscana TaxID=6661 RepID=A0AA88KYK5_ARTSF|nr:hypothetical protein QYM36_014782 [Artemia franciscana]
MDETTKFHDLCLVFEDIKQSESKRRYLKLKSFIEELRQKLIQLEKGLGKEISLFPILRLMLPLLDHSRGVYGIKESKLALLYLKVLSIPKTAPDAKKLLEYRTPKSSKTAAKDFADFAYLVLRDRLPKGKDVTVKYVNEELDKLANYNAIKQGDTSEVVLENLLRSLSALEQKWLIRIILKNLKLGTGQNGILAAYHPDAKDMYDKVNSLEKVCEKLKDPNVRLFQFEISLFTPFKPMLAERGNIEKIDTFLAKTEAILEMKLDGERQQLHKKGKEYKYFSRNCFDYSSCFGPSPSSGSLTPYIHEAFSENVDSCILDGEMMVYDKRLEMPLQKGENYDVKSLKANSSLVPSFYVFDILFLNGEVLTSKPLKERLKLLETVFVPIEGSIMPTYRKALTSKQMLIQELNSAIDRREEGIIVKDSNSLYAPNSRKQGWIKIKPEYSGVLGDHLDLLIIGGYYGEGRKHGIISSFLLGAAVPSSEPGGITYFHSFSRVGSGYTLEELQQLLSKLEKFWKPVKKDKPMPSTIVWSREKPDLWIAPEDSQVLEVKASEFTDSDAYKIGFTLRFPRVEHVRYDKSYRDCTTLKELLEIRERGGGKLFSRPYDGIDRTREKRKKVVTEKEVRVAPQFAGANLTDVSVEKDIFQGKEFCVMNGTSMSDKEYLQKLIRSLGGVVVQNPGATTSYVIAQNENIRVKNLIKSGKYDIIKPDWILRCSFEKKFLRFTPSDAICLTGPSQKSLLGSFDIYGDNYTEPIGKAQLEKIFDNMKGEYSASKREIVDVESVEFPVLPKYSLFRPCMVFVDSESNALRLKLKFYGACLAPEVTEYVTHAIADSASDIKRLKDVRHESSGKFFIVSSNWVYDSVTDNRLKPESEYLL